MISEELLIDIVIACKSEFIEMLDFNVKTKFCLYLLIKITVCDLMSRFDEESKVVNVGCETVVLLFLKIHDS